MKRILAICILLCTTTISYAMTLEEYIEQYNKSHGSEIAHYIKESAYKYNLDPLFLSSIFKIESGYDNTAVSSAGALGIAQLMPFTADELGVNPSSIKENIDGGARYIRQMINQHQDKGIYTYNFALASYNAGYGNATNHIPSYTYGYISDIKDEYQTQQRLIYDASPSQENLELTANQKKKELLLSLLQLKKALMQNQAKKYKSNTKNIVF